MSSHRYSRKISRTEINHIYLYNTLSIDHLEDLLPQLDKKSSVLQNFKIHSTTCSRLQRNAIAPLFMQNLRTEAL